MKLKLTTILALIVILGGVIFFYKTQRVSNLPMETPEIVSNSSGEFRFIGRIKEIDTSCEVDGTCRIKVEKVWITTFSGGDEMTEEPAKRVPSGQLLLGNYNFYTSREALINKKVEVYVKAIDEETATLYGNSDYYVKIL